MFKKLLSTAATGALAAGVLGGVAAVPAQAAQPVVSQAVKVGYVKGTERTVTVRTGRVGIWNVYTTTTYQKFRTSVGTFEVIKHQSKSYKANLRG